MPQCLLQGLNAIKQSLIALAISEVSAAAPAGTTHSFKSKNKIKKKKQTHDLSFYQISSIIMKWITLT